MTEKELKSIGFKSKPKFEGLGLRVNHSLYVVFMYDEFYLENEVGDHVKLNVVSLDHLSRIINILQETT